MPDVYDDVARVGAAAGAGVKAWRFVGTALHPFAPTSGDARRHLVFLAYVTSSESPYHIFCDGATLHAYGAAVHEVLAARALTCLQCIATTARLFRGVR